MVGKKDRPDNG